METIALAKFAAAFAFVMGLMGLLSWFLKKTGLSETVKMSGGKRRLKIVETLPLDHRRRLVLLQRDNKEHLVILGASSETVIEADISASEDNVVTLPAAKLANKD